MSESAYQALKRALENRGTETTITVDGYTTFLFLKRDGTQKVGMDYNTIIRNLMKKYNKWHKESLPNITPHSLSAYVLYLYGKRRYESLGVAVHHGPCQNNHLDSGLLHPCGCLFRKGGDGAVNCVVKRK